MKLDYSFIKSFLQNKRLYPTLIIIVLDVIVLAVLIYYGLQIRTAYQDMLSAEDKVQEMKATITLIRNNQTVFDGRLEEYNSLLEQLIPDQESYFSVITTLEQLSARTGVTIESYSVNLGSTTEEKLTLTLAVQGTPESLQQFIRDYRYAGGRLLTTESLDIDPQQLESISISLNFYHNEFKDTVSSESRVKQEDLRKLDEIRQAMQ